LAIRYAPNSPFRADLETEVAAYFASTGRARQGSPALRAKALVLGIWLALSYGALVWGARTTWESVLAAVSLAVAMAGVGFNIQHDGGHKAFGTGQRLNRAMAFSLDLLGGSSYFWRYKHAVAHHGYPNLVGADDDINVGLLARFTPHDRQRWFHRYQHLYIWPLYAFLAIKWQLVDDFVSLARPGVGDTPVPRPTKAERLLFWGGKALFFFLALGLPMAFRSPGGVVALYLLSGAILGLLLSVVFQLAHCLGEASFPNPPPPERRLAVDFATHQVEATVDFAPTNRVLTWFIGGLNFQIEHHLFPRVCHTHYPALTGIVKRVCDRHGVRHTTHATAWRALRSHYRWLRLLGRG
jgi:linoleoyl-CoA desaturase